MISSRVRIARNVAGYRFPHMLGPREKEKIEASVAAALPHLQAFRLADLGLERCSRLASWRLIPVEYARKSEGMVLLDQRGAVCVLLNEEDHLRIQCFGPGSQCRPAAEEATAIEKLLWRDLVPAWNNAFGYLTASPANAGSGIRASALCHLAALCETGRLARWIAAGRRSGWVLRGVLGEGSKALGGFFQLSLLANRDESALEASHRLEEAVRLLANEERKAREALGDGGIAERAEQCVEFVRGASSASLSEALRVLGWIRLEAALRSESACREVDAASTEMLLEQPKGEGTAARRRIAALRRLVAQSE